MNKQEAYKIVLMDLMKCGLLTGHYDASHGNEHFMYGISTVMECIAYNVSETVGDRFSDLFTKNMVKSEEKVLTKEE